ncbi:MAG: MerR family DNA-binding transcriptional regulator [Lachnospiraceae bacterium]|nr:MerR family DNA-binding transcriptional regulator [Lachnospiraceae bacterium]
MEEFLSIGEFAKLIQVSVSTLRNWEKKGRLLPHHRTAGGQRVYAKAQADEFLKKPRIRVIQGRKKRDVYYFNYEDNSVTDKVGNRLILMEAPDGVQDVTLEDAMDILFKDLYSNLNMIKKEFDFDKKMGDKVKWIRMS